MTNANMDRFYIDIDMASGTGETRTSVGGESDRRSGPGGPQV